MCAHSLLLCILRFLRDGYFLKIGDLSNVALDVINLFDDFEGGVIKSPFDDFDAAFVGVLCYYKFTFNLNFCT